MTTITATPQTDLFTAIVAAFDQVPRCEIRAPGGRCPNPARWHANCHDCARGLICVRHLRAFAGQAGPGEPVECNRCGRVFDSIEQAVTLVVL